MKDAEKTEIILKKLKDYYCSWGRGRCNVLFPELRLGSGYSDIAQRRIDLFLISSEKGNYTTAFEIKVSRGDFLKDIKDEAKQRGARLYSSNFYYVAPKGMIKPEEIPVWAGLKEYDFEEDKLSTKLVAPLQSRNNPSWSLICSIVRRVNDALYSSRIEELEQQNKYYKQLFKKYFEISQMLFNKDFGEYEELKKDLIKQELDIDSYLLKEV